MARLACAFGATFHLALWAHTYTSLWSKSSGCPQCLQATHVPSWSTRRWGALDLVCRLGARRRRNPTPVILRLESTLSIDPFP